MDRSVGRRYRSTVLEKGGSHDDKHIMTEILDRRVRMEAFRHELGLLDIIKRNNGSYFPLSFL
ncbi:hypothetical protein BDV23DRAFT_156432, partial [Aspergillus alliaceus]